MKNEAFAQVKVDSLLAAQGWDTLDTNAVRFEVQLPDGTRADYVLCDCHGRSLAVIEAKRCSVSPGDAAAQAKAYAQQLGVPYAFLCNGDEVLFWEWQCEAYPRPVKTIRVLRPRNIGESVFARCAPVRASPSTGPRTGPRPGHGLTEPA